LNSIDSADFTIREPPVGKLAVAGVILKEYQNSVIFEKKLSCYLKIKKLNNNE